VQQQNIVGSSDSFSSRLGFEQDYLRINYLAKFSIQESAEEKTPITLNKYPTFYAENG
jgi:hypothetical protein